MSVESLRAAVEAINKAHGAGSVCMLGDNAVTSIDTIPTGSIGLDCALGTGGWPRGRIVELYGPEMGGKSTLAMHAVSEAQRLNLGAAYVDAEHALDLSYAANLGVNVQQLLVSQPDCGEHALDITETLIRTGEVSIVVIDSVAALTPKAEIDGEMGDNHMGLHARLMSQAMRKLCSIAHANNVCVIFINQIRLKIGVVFGNPETTTGGNALKFYASVRCDVRRKEAIKRGSGDDAEVIGSNVHIKVVKNKLAAPFREADLTLLFGQGFDRATELLQAGVDTGHIDQSGAWYSFEGERIGQGQRNAADALRKDPALYARIIAPVRVALGLVR